MTITINQFQYPKSEVYRMVMKRAHELKRMWCSSFAKALSIAWNEIKHQITNMQMSKLAETKEEYAALPVEHKLMFVEHRIFHLKMIDRWGQKEFALDRKLENERVALVAKLTA